MSLISASSWAYDFELNGIYYNILGVGKVEITKGDSAYEGNVFMFPDSVEYLNKIFFVTEIGERAFENAKIKTVIIPASVTTIREYAFAYSTISSITIPTNVKECNGLIFAYCKHLREIHFDYGEVLYFSTNFNDGSSTFVGCDSLESVYIDRYISVWASDNNHSGHKHSRNNYFFSGLGSIKNVFLGEMLKEIGNWFKNCSGIEKVVIPSNIYKIDSHAFYNCYNLSEIEFSDGKKRIYRDAFTGCRKLKVIDFKEGDLEITDSYTGDADSESGAFNGCDSLHTLVFPSGELKLDHAVFNDCKQIEKIYCKTSTPKEIYSNVFNSRVQYFATLYVPLDAKSNYENTAGWRDFANIVEGEFKQEDNDKGGSSDEKKICQKPIISIENSVLKIESPQSKGTCLYKISSNDISNGYFSEHKQIELTGVYIVTAYCIAEGYQNSETVTATLVWVNPTLKDNVTNVQSMEAKKAILLKSTDNSITIFGMENDEVIQLYTVDGQLQDTIVANGNEASIGNGLTRNSIYIVKIGNKSIKYKF